MSGNRVFFDETTIYNGNSRKIRRRKRNTLFSKLCGPSHGQGGTQIFVLGGMLFAESPLRRLPRARTLSRYPSQTCHIKTPITMTSRDDLVYMAKLAEQAER